MKSVLLGYQIGTGKPVEVPIRHLAVTGQTTMDVGNGHWLAGLTDGEGCFLLNTTRVRSARGYDRKYRCLTFEFKIALRADDLETVQMAHALLGVGRVNVYRRSGRSTSRNAKPLATLTVYRRSDIARVIEVFRAYPLRSKKQRDFALWAAAFDRYSAALSSSPLLGLSSNSIVRPSLRRRRPLAGKQRERFRAIPDTLWNEMRSFQERIESIRQFKVPA